MALNDAILIDGILEQRMAAKGRSVGDAFEIFAFEQLLKDYDLSAEEIESGWVDGQDDGGIDGIYLFVNGHLLRDLAVFPWPKRNAEMELWIVTSKHHATFQQAPLNSLLASIPELLDLSKGRTDLDGHYSSELLDAKDLLHAAYRRLSVMNPRLVIRFVYVSRGDSSAVAENIQARADQIASLGRAMFSSADVAFLFLGAAELVERHRRVKRFSIDLPCVEYLARGSASYVVLVKLDDYYRFVCDEEGALRRYLFDSNVRDYLGDNRVNEDILTSLEDAAAPDFWWLNNGVTVLATQAAAVGKTIQLQDIQIVNGLQTTETIFRHVSGAAPRAASSRALLVKIIVSTDSTVRDRIIMATNNQSVVELASLRATDKVQRDIEQALERSDWYYERRKNYYRNIGKPPARFVTPLYLAAGYVSLIQRNPAAASALKSRFMQDDEGYSSVFSEAVPVRTWVGIVEVLERVEECLEQLRPKGGSERFLASWRNVVAFLCVARHFGRFSFSERDIEKIDAGGITMERVSEAWDLIQEARKDETATEKLTKKERFVAKCCRILAERHGVEHLSALRSSLPGHLRASDLLDRVDAELPDQPWKPRVHLLVCWWA